MTSKLFISSHQYLFIIGFIFSQVITSCRHDLQAQKIEAVEVLDISPLMKETYYKVYYMDSLVMYESRHLYDSSVKQFRLDNKTQEMYSEDTLLVREWRSRFFVFHKDSTYGVRYDPHGEQKEVRMPVNYEIKRIEGTNRFDSFLSVKPDTVSWNTDKTECREVFVLNHKIHSPTGRLIFYYSKRLNHLKKSFNPTVDKAKGMKLFKYEIMFDEFYSEKPKRLWPSTLDVTEMKETVVKDPEDVMGYFNQYKRSILKTS